MLCEEFHRFSELVGYLVPNLRIVFWLWLPWNFVFAGFRV